MPYGNYAAADPYAHHNHPQQQQQQQQQQGNPKSGAKNAPLATPKAAPYPAAPPYANMPGPYRNSAYPIPGASSRPGPSARRQSNALKPSTTTSSGGSKRASHRRSRSSSTVEVKGWERTRPRPSAKTAASAGAVAGESRSKGGEGGKKRKSGGGGGGGACVIF